MGIAASLFYSTNDPENCLDWRIRPSDEQYDSQKQRWNDLADHLLTDLEKESQCTMYSWLQGSYKFGTQVRPAKPDHEFDIDLGIYFCWGGEPDEGPHSALGLKTFVQQSLETYAAQLTNDAEGVEAPRARCSRVHFSGKFHIDVPSYHLDIDRDARALATADDAWEDSDPKVIYAWWTDNLSDEERPRCRRIVRYLKMWAALKFEDESRPSSILLTVLAAQAYLQTTLNALSGDDEVIHAVVDKLVKRLNASGKVPNPANRDENLNRLSDSDVRDFRHKLEEFWSIAERGLAAQSKLEASEIWSEAFEHFFPAPSVEELKEEALLKARTGTALARIQFDPMVNVHAVSGAQTYTGINKIGPIPKGCAIRFTLANAHQLPVGANVRWMVRNKGDEAETENDLGHRAADGQWADEHSAYRGTHYMDVTVKVNGLLIGSRRIPVTISNIGAVLRNPPRPNWTKFRSRRR